MLFVVRPREYLPCTGWSSGGLESGLDSGRESVGPGLAAIPPVLSGEW